MNTMAMLHLTMMSPKIIVQILGNQRLESVKSYPIRRNQRTSKSSLTFDNVLASSMKYFLIFLSPPSLLHTSNGVRVLKCLEIHFLKNIFGWCLYFWLMISTLYLFCFPGKEEKAQQVHLSFFFFPFLFRLYLDPNVNLWIRRSSFCKES